MIRVVDKWGLCLLVCWLFGLVSQPAFSEWKKQVLRPALSGLALELHFVKTSNWALSRTEIPAANGFGLQLSHGLFRYLAPYLTLDIALYGNELSGFSTYSAGTRVRFPTLSPLILYLSGGLGRLGESGGVSFTFAEVGGGAKLFLSNRFAIDFDFVLITAIDSGSSNRPTKRTPLIRDGNLRRLRVGMSWHFGRVNN